MRMVSATARGTMTATICSVTMSASTREFALTTIRRGPNVFASVSRNVNQEEPTMSIRKIEATALCLTLLILASAAYSHPRKRADVAKKLSLANHLNSTGAQKRKVRGNRIKVRPGYVLKLEENRLSIVRSKGKGGRGNETIMGTVTIDCHCSKEGGCLGIFEPPSHYYCASRGCNGTCDMYILIPEFQVLDRLRRQGILY